MLIQKKANKQRKDTMTKSHSNNLNDERLELIEHEVEMNVRHLEESDIEQEQLCFVNDESKANDVLYWHKRTTEDIQKVHEYMKNEIERIELFSWAKIEHMQKKLKFYEGALESFLMASGDKSKSLINGKIGTRKSPDKIIVEDDEKFIKWYYTNKTGIEPLIKSETIQKPILKEIKKYIKESGECPPDVTYQTGQLKFYIKTHE